MFVQQAFEDPLYYFSVVTTLIVSIILHELAHGWAALWQGDDTPRASGHMTADPFVHMGPISLAAVFLAGMGWGMMPVNPHRFRSRHGDVLVSLAGPAMNLLLAFVGLTVLGALGTAGTLPLYHDPEASGWRPGTSQLLWVFGIYNVALAIFNLAPVPPLDGSTVLAGLHHGYRRWLADNYHLHQPLFIGYIILIIATSGMPYGLWGLARAAASGYLSLF